MSQAPMSGRPSRSLLWVLLILPVCLLAGWLVGAMPTPKVPARTQSAAVAQPGTPPANAAVDLTPAESGHRPGESPRPEISQWTTLDAAIAESQRNGKPVLIDFNAEWCGPCRMMKQGVFDDWNLGQTVQKAVIPVSIVDRAREDGRNPTEIESLQQRYQVDAFPTLVVFSPASGRMEKIKGYGGPEWTVKWITEAARTVSR